MNTFRLIKFVLNHPQSCDNLFEKINSAAQGHGCSEYGLPLRDEAHSALFRELLVHWLLQIADEMAQIADEVNDE